jgi:AbrB family looped-hinge helix DNA binding protein
MPQELDLTTSVGEGGRVVIPANLRKKMGLNVGDQVVLRVENDELRIFTRKQALRQAQAFVRGLVEPGVSLANELMEERRAEAQNE